MSELEIKKPLIIISCDGRRTWGSLWCKSLAPSESQAGREGQQESIAI